MAVISRRDKALMLVRLAEAVMRSNAQWTGNPQAVGAQARQLYDALFTDPIRVPKGRKPAA